MGSYRFGKFACNKHVFNGSGSADCWNSVISYAVSYIGATFLGLIVFYNTRQRQHFEDKE